MKALEKDRTRRYETANGFAMDIERFLADEPVAAGPPGTLPAAEVCAAQSGTGARGRPGSAGSCLAGVAGTAFGLMRAERQRRKAERAAVAERQAKQEAEARQAEAEKQQRAPRRARNWPASG